MKNLVKGLLKGQEERRAEIEKGFVVERRSLGEKLVAELNESLIALGCEDLIASNETVVNNVSINKGKVVEVVREVEVVKEVIKEVPVVKEVVKEVVVENNDKDVLVKAIAAKDKYIVELETKLQDKAYIAANDGFVVEGVEVSLKVVEKLNEEITKLQEELAKLEKERDAYKKSSESFQSRYAKVKNERARLQEAIADLEADRIDVNVKEEIKEEVEAKEKETIVENKKEEVQIKDELVKLDKYANKRRDDVVMHCNSKFYVMSSDKCKEITVIPRNLSIKVTDEDVKAIEAELVNKLGYRIDRDVVSPVTVQMDKGYLQGYFARTDAKEGRLVFSDHDFFGGYVICNTGTYLWSWDGKSELCAVYHLDKVIVGDKNRSVTPGTARMVTKEVKEMYKDYLVKVGEIQKANAEQLAKNTAAANEKKAQMAAHNALFAQAMELEINASNSVVKEEPVNETKQEQNFSDFTMAFLESF